MFNRPGIFVQLLVYTAVAWACTVSAQTTTIEVNVPPNDIGLGGVVRPGSFTPLLITMKNTSASPRRVRCRWIVPDSDGDPVVNQRVITLSPQRTQQAWLYATPPYTARDGKLGWRIEIIDDKTGKLITSQKLEVNDLVKPRINVIGVTGSQSLGLLRFAENYTRHEKTRFVRNLDPGKLPDRWYGLSTLQALVWTPDSPDPSAPSVSPETIKAIHQWVQRGGHLIVMLPAIGEDLWLNSPISDMLPDVEVESDRTWVDALGSKKTSSEQDEVYDVKYLLPKAANVTPLLTHKDKPWVVARPFGFGRVTLIGADLSNRQLVAKNLPKSGDLWTSIFGWRDPANRSDVIKAKANYYLGSGADDLGGFVRPAIAMRESFSGAMLLAIMVFVLYWLAAGPVGFAVLKYKDKTRHAWLVFVAMVILFSVVCWGGAMVIRPSRSTVAHVSILDINANSNKIHTHSWLSLFVAKHGRVNVVLDPDRKEGNRSTLTTAGLPASDFGSVFLDPQRYTVNAAAPNRVSVPYRSTAKLFEVDYEGRLNAEPDENQVQWVLPQTYQLRLANDGFPTGQISHGLPGTLSDVLMVFCPGDGKEPYVWKHGEWKSNQIMQVQRPTVDKLSPLARKYTVKGKPEWRGYLSKLLGHNSSVLDSMLSGEPLNRSLAGNELVTFSELLSFYSVLPPPKYWDEDLNTNSKRFYRSVGRELDLSHRLSSRCLIIIGYMKNAPLPAPIIVDGRKIKGSGWTMVRWVYLFSG